MNEEKSIKLLDEFFEKTSDETLDEYIRRINRRDIADDVAFEEYIKYLNEMFNNSLDEKQISNMKDKFEEYLEDCAEVGMKIKAIQKEEREKVIDEICAFLDEHLYTGTSTGDYDYGQEYICSDFNNATDLILTLRKKFEE